MGDTLESNEREIDRQQDNLATRLIEIINSKIQNALSKLNLLKRVHGVVVSYDDSTGYAFVLVNAMSVRVMNKSGELLSAGDTVQIHYWKNISSGYIAVRNGKPKPLGGGGFAINNAVIMTENQSVIYNIETGQINIDVKNRCSVTYGSPRNVIIVQGYIAYCDNTNSMSIILNNKDEFYKYAAGNKITVKFNEYKPEKDYTFEMKLKDLNNTAAYGYQASYRVYQNNNLVEQIQIGSYGNINRANISQKVSSSATIINFTKLFKPSFVIQALSIVEPTETWQYGGINCQILCGLFDDNDNLVTGASITNNIANYYCFRMQDINSNQWGIQCLLFPYLTEEDDGYPSSGSKKLAFLPFASQAEYDYAKNITAKSELPPSLDVINP